MKKLLVVCLLAISYVHAQTAAKPNPHVAAAAMLLFAEADHPTGPPDGWGGGHPESMAMDPAAVHDGEPALRIVRKSSTETDTFTPLTSSLPIDFPGTNVELSGYLRVENVTGTGALWLRADDAGHSPVAFQNSEGEKFQGTAGWRKFSVHIVLPETAKRMMFGALLSGTGTLWVSGLHLSVDGVPFEQVPVRTPVPGILDTDQEFAGGSHIQLKSLTDVQVESLATLAEVWGFLKYHHPAVTSGKHHWDFDLFREMPTMLAARTPRERNAKLLAWIDSLGPVAPCSPCAQLPATGVQLGPDLGWLRDSHHLGAALSARLQAIYTNRPAGPGQFYFGASPLDGPEFEHELGYADVKMPDCGYQLLLLFRWWNVLEWASPNRALLPDLHRTLRAYIRPMALAQDKQTFTLETLKLIGEARDSHSNLWSSLDDRPPTGPCAIPVALRFLGEQLVVWEATDKTALRRGDILTALGGHAVSQLVKERLPYYAGSNLPVRLRDVATDFTRGDCGPVTVDVTRGGAKFPLDTARTHDTAPSAWRHDLGGEAFHLLSPEVAYLQLGAVKLEDVPSYVDRAKGTRGWIIDIRNYPTAFMPFSLGPHLVDHVTTFARFTAAHPENPGAFTLAPESVAQIHPAAPRYTGKIVLLVDEVSQSQAEYTTMALRSAPGAVVLGSHTAGADGNVSQVPLPFGMRTMISGLGVLTPELKKTQQVGVAVDKQVLPTAAGIAANRDEVIEAAVRLILPSATEDEVRRLGKR